jgi:hypothetical protein
VYENDSIAGKITKKKAVPVRGQLLNIINRDQLFFNDPANMGSIISTGQPDKVHSVGER